jgi:TolA-binding protein
MLKSMWWSHIPNIDAFPVIRGFEPEKTPEQIAAEAAASLAAAGGAGGGNSDDQELDPQKKIAALTEEKDRHWTKAQEAEQKLQEQLAELEELRTFKQTKDQESLTEEQKIEAKLAEFDVALKAKDVEIEKLKEASKRLTIKNAFLAQNDVKWHDAESALSLADLSEVEIVDGKDGIPTLKNDVAMKNAIQKLAETKSYLVDTSEGEPVWEGKTGDKVQKRQVANEATKREKLLKEYPALRR